MASRKRYSREFKLEAARLVVERGYSAKKAAERVGCNAWSLRDWVNKFRCEGVFPTVNEPVPEADELKRLRK
ncbi:MAG: transposase [Planctomycetes bacterium]|nr:transposase [Planctomycetota bacterium]